MSISEPAIAVLAVFGALLIVFAIHLYYVWNRRRNVSGGMGDRRSSLKKSLTSAAALAYEKLPGVRPRAQARERSYGVVDQNQQNRGTTSAAGREGGEGAGLRAASHSRPGRKTTLNEQGKTVDEFSNPLSIRAPPTAADAWIAESSSSANIHKTKMRPARGRGPTTANSNNALSLTIEEPETLET
eukprot:UC1_evm1s92